MRKRDSGKSTSLHVADLKSVYPIYSVMKQDLSMNFRQDHIGYSREEV